ncbi:hypothetical protein XM57_27590 [Burkholderia cepacia]|nr:hypothetical protein XM57_27590 [Burkholderia cepacia]ETP63780.1 hypothetical protein BDSB_21790 [Burkholderia dolosa PC543]
MMRAQQNRGASAARADAARQRSRSSGAIAGCAAADAARSSIRSDASTLSTLAACCSAAQRLNEP